MAAIFPRMGLSLTCSLLTFPSPYRGGAAQCNMERSKQTDDLEGRGEGGGAEGPTARRDGGRVGSAHIQC